jgi:hypothetical protein
MAELGVNEENNVIELWQTEIMDGPDQGKTVLKPVPIFREGKRGIDILVYELKQHKIKYQKEYHGEISRWKSDYCITRLEHPRQRADGSEQKYDKPKGEPSYPFFPPKLVQKYAAKQPIKALYITEGFFKAFKADMHGIDCIGLQSITCLRDKATNAIWSDIKAIVEECKVEHLVWLTDGDYNNITSGELKDGVDLSKRPHNFYSTVHTFAELTSQLADVERYFAHINTETIPGNPKGLDDMLIALPDQVHNIYTEFSNFSIMAPGKVYPGAYITRINISQHTGRVRKYFHLDDVTNFFLHHSERRPEIKNLNNFCFYGTTYRYDDKEGKCIVEIPGDASLYIRVGNDFYKNIMMPVKKDEENDKFKKVLSPRQKGTIVDDYGKEFIKHIKKYEAPCIIPNHDNYQQVVHNCYNLYHPFTHEPEEGDCSHTLEFIKHIFGEDTVSYTQPNSGAIVQFPRYELGLDYFTILYKKPWQMLPILCLVSNERQTGKTTFLNYVDALFEENAISIGNEDLEADFNAHWAGKLAIMVDETKVDNGKVINKIKRLSTAKEVILNSKGKDQVKLPFFAKFILTSNHVDNFIRIDKEEIRFWIHRIRPLKTYNPHFMAQLIEEIPAFLHLLNTRKMVTANEERHWFKTSLLETEALNIVKANSVSSMEKRIRTEIESLFELAPEMHIIGIPLKELAPMVKGEKDYVRQVLQNDMGMRTVNGRFKYPQRRQDFQGNPGSKPVIEVSFDIVTGGPTSHYEFKREDFVKTITTVVPAVQEESTVAATENDVPF